MSVSGRAGLFTMDDGRFFGDLRGTPYTASKRQKSGALRLEFGQLTLANAGVTSATVYTTVGIGVAAVATWNRLPVPITPMASGTWAVATNNYVSNYLPLQIVSDGQYSGWNSGATINYMVIGY